MRKDRRINVFVRKEDERALPVVIRPQKGPEIERDDPLLELTRGEAYSLFLALRTKGLDQDPRGTASYRGRNYRLCTAIDLTKLNMVRDELIEAGANEGDVVLLIAIVRNALEVLRNLNPED